MPGVVKLELEGGQYLELSNAIRERFGRTELGRVIKMRLSKNWDDLVEEHGDYKQNVFDIINEANRKGWVYRLVNALREEIPFDPVFVEYARLLNLAPEGTPDRARFESIVRETNMALDIAVFLSGLGKVEAQVCRVDLDGAGKGTGFLVGPNLVMTNYHVVEKVVNEEYPVEALTCRFDFKVLPNGKSINPGTVFPVTKLAACSPYDEADLVDDGSAPDPSNLDYALLEVGGEPGKNPVGGKPNGAPRRWVAIGEGKRELKANDPLFIAQHPNTLPMKLALDTQSVIGPYGGGLRVRHRTNTEPGSSGSPCFDPNWNLVALHHSGDLSWKPQWNEAIPIHLVRDHARKNGVPLGVEKPPEDDEFDM